MAGPDARRTDGLLRVLNSTPMLDGEPRDLLDPDDAFLRRVRDALQDVVRGGDPAVLRPLLDDVVRRPVVGGAGITWEVEVDADRALGVELILTWGDVQRDLPGRLRPCANEACRLFLLDRSRSGVGRWCSMEVCGNRAKARRHYERHRAGGRDAQRPATASSGGPEGAATDQ